MEFKITSEWHLPFFIIMLILLTGYLYFFYIAGLSDEARNDYVNNVYVELAGAIFDIFVFGILIYLVQLFYKKREKIDRYIEELDDYRYWNEKEAGYRIIGILKRLHKLGVENVDLTGCHFVEIDIVQDDGSTFGFDFLVSNLTNTRFERMQLLGANFNRVCDNNPCINLYEYFHADRRTMFTEAILNSAQFSNNEFTYYNFTDCRVDDATIVDSTFFGAQFRNCTLNNTKIKLTTFQSSFFKDCDLSVATIQDTKFIKCKFENCILPQKIDSVIYEECHFDPEDKA